MILIGLGSNLNTDQYPTSKAVVQAALTEMEKEGLQVLKCSSFYETEPVPKSDQAWYVNAVAIIKTDLKAFDLLDLLHRIEQKLGRTRRERWEARVIDLDLLCYNNMVVPEAVEWKSGKNGIEGSELIIPHIRMHERNFVLVPLNEIAHEWKHPVFGKNAGQLLQEQESTGKVRQLQ